MSKPAKNESPEAGPKVRKEVKLEATHVIPARAAVEVRRTLTGFNVNIESRVIEANYRITRDGAAPVHRTVVLQDGQSRIHQMGLSETTKQTDDGFDDLADDVALFAKALHEAIEKHQLE